MIEILECEQGGEEWRHARLGIPTSSNFAAIMANGKDGGDSKTRRKYMLKLAAEILTGTPLETFSNGHMDRGRVLEDEARNAYAFMTDTCPERVGFIRNGNKGCSPDSLIGSDGMLEIKTKLPDLLLDAILKDSFPPAHRAQCQGALWVAEREWIDIAIYWPGLPLFVKRATRDEDYIKRISDAVDAFYEEIAEVVMKIRLYMEFST